MELNIMLRHRVVGKEGGQLLSVKNLLFSSINNVTKSIVTKIESYMEKNGSNTVTIFVYKDSLEVVVDQYIHNFSFQSFIVDEDVPVDLSKPIIDSLVTEFNSLHWERAVSI